MVKVERSTVIDAPVSEVWAILRDFNGHDRWHPAVAHSRLEDGRRDTQIGAVRSFALSGGESLREQLLSLSDKDRSFRYAIVESEIPLQGYVAEVKLKPVTDGNRTFWSWSSRFNTPPGQEDELAELVARNVYEAGFKAIRARVEGGARIPEPPRAMTQPESGAAPAVSGAALPGFAMTIARHGGPEEFRRSKITAPPPGPGQVRLRQSAVGVNFIDVYSRSGYFDLLTPPGTLGMEAAGTVVDIGPGVSHLMPGQRAAYACPPAGAYASVRTLDASLVVALPEGLDTEMAAAGLLKGMSAEFLLHRVHRLQRGETALIYAPAGGVGRILCQWAKHLGATVIGATSSEEKARIARAAGAQHVILPGPKSLEEQVMELTGGKGADVIYDAVGRDSFVHSLAAIAHCGHLVSYGQASGDIGSYDIGSLAARSVTLSRPNFAHYTDTPEKIAAITERLFDAIARRVVTIEIGQRFKLSEAAAAHRALEARETTGSTVLIPDAEEGTAG